jgi:hypothetical protein
MGKIFRGPTLQLARSENPHRGRVPVVTITRDVGAERADCVAVATDLAASYSATSVKSKALSAGTPLHGFCAPE